MKIKNKVRINVIIVAFAVIFAVGTAFALTADRPLIFDGIVNVDVELLVGIDYEVWSKSTGNPGAVQLLMPTFADPIPGRGGLHPPYSQPWGFGKTAFVHFSFSDITTAEMTFWIENLGTIDAWVYIDIWNDGSNPFIIIEHKFTPQYLAPGQRAQVQFTIGFDEGHLPPDSDYIDESAEFYLILHYSRSSS